MSRWTAIHRDRFEDLGELPDPSDYPALARPTDGFVGYLERHPGGQVLASLLHGRADVYRLVIDAELSPNFFPYDLAYPLAAVLLADKAYVARVLAGEIERADIIDQLDRYDLYAGNLEESDYLLDSGEDGVFWATYTLRCLNWISQKWAGTDEDMAALPTLIAELKRLHAADIGVDLFNFLTEKDNEKPGHHGGAGGGADWVSYADIRFALSSLSWSDAQIVAEMKNKLATGVLVKQQKGKVSYWRLAGGEVNA